MRERDIEKRLRKGIEALGGLAYKFTSPGNDGVPDRVVILPDRRVIFVELKARNGRLSLVQQWQHDHMRAAGAGVVTVFGLEGVEKFIQALRSGTDEILATYGPKGGAAG